MNRSILVAAATALVMAGPLGATARADQTPAHQETQQSPCVLLGHRVLSITPHWVMETNGKRTRHLTGADVQIEAEPGMTAEYLTVEVRRYLSSGTGYPACVLGVPGSTVQVVSTGDGFVFHVTAADTKIADEIVRRARSLG
jgi:hypothetical protein